jgi:dephospho-CoA kinase
MSMKLLTKTGFLKLSNDVCYKYDLIVVTPGRKAWKEIRRVFGEDVLEADGQLDRRKLASVIFGDAQKRKQLNSITHPEIAKEVGWEIISYFFRGSKTIKIVEMIAYPDPAQRTICLHTNACFVCTHAGYQFVIIDSPLLFEAKTWVRLAHKVIVVSWYSNKRTLIIIMNR